MDLSHQHLNPEHQKNNLLSLIPSLLASPFHLNPHNYFKNSEKGLFSLDHKKIIKMHSSLLTISATLALCLSVASANPFPVGGGAPLCQDQYAYIITNQWNDHGTPVVGTQTIAAGDGSEFSL